MESALLTPTNQISHRKQGHRLLFTTSPTFCVCDSHSNHKLIFTHIQTATAPMVCVFVVFLTYMQPNSSCAVTADRMTDCEKKNRQSEKGEITRKKVRMRSTRYGETFLHNSEGMCGTNQSKGKRL